jgi:organic hydroperoxide reductase OsmC/OhrA
MNTYTAEVFWSRSHDQQFVDGRYSRRHVLRFDGGVEVPGSASPHVVPLPYSAADAVDPEEAFVSSLSSCHMLWFLSIAASRGFVVDRYHDSAEGVMDRNSTGKLTVALVILRPAVEFSGARQPTFVEIEHMHHLAHDECFIANSVKTTVRCEPRQCVLAYVHHANY